MQSTGDTSIFSDKARPHLTAHGFDLCIEFTGNHGGLERVERLDQIFQRPDFDGLLALRNF
ncbi:hypothetical protein [Burkholderia gladioli]|uniref:hypothetical protein n=1 Tax=Burkholderia gladioli TaxID=28095 RepID=UPI0016413CDB|nr:hypothetical protein [Burkholderia gladioli]